MGRRHGGWPERAPRPKATKLSREEQQRLQARATKFVGESLILREIVEAVQLARGRLYLRRDREDEDLMARITPLGPRWMLPEAHVATSGMPGSFHGTCLYAPKDDEWGCYTIKPRASETIATAET